MNPVRLLWMLIATLAIVVAAMLIFLVFARLYTGARETLRQSRRARLVPLFLKEQLSPNEHRLLASATESALTDVCLELLQMVRGDEKQLIIEAGDRFSVPAELHRRLKSRSSGVRLAAAEALAAFGDAATLAQLGEALDDADGNVRLAAAISLQSLNRAPPLIELVRKLGLGNEECSRFIVKLFRDRARGEASEVIALLTDDDLSPAIKAQAAEALASEGRYEVVAVIASIVLAGDGVGVGVAACVRSLGELAHPDGAEAVIFALSSRDWEVRAAAAQAAGKMKLSSTANRLGALLNDPHWLVRFRSSEALGQIGNPGTRALEHAAAGVPGAGQEAAAIVLAQRDR